MKITNFIAVCYLLLACSACTVSFLGTSIDYNKIKSFSVEQFETEAGNAPATAGQQFSEQLKAKIISNTRLQNLAENGDLHFRGAVKSFQLTSLAPQANQTTSLQRLTMGVEVVCASPIDAEDATLNWTQTFTRFADFASDANLLDVQDQLIRDIYLQMMDDVFNKAFTNW